MVKPGFLHRGTGGTTPESGSPPQEPAAADSPARPEDRACCCPAQPLVRVIMPPAAGRPHSVDLLLCGHHYRVSRAALAAAGAITAYLPGKADAAEAALLEGPASTAPKSSECDVPRPGAADAGPWR